MREADRFLARYAALSRRFFLRAGVVSMASGVAFGGSVAKTLPPELAEAVGKIEPFFTTQEEFGDVSRGKPLPHSLPLDKKKEVGLTRETWKLEIVSDPEKPATLGKQFTKKDGNALDFVGLLKLGERHAVRFAKVMTCLNIGCPLGTGIWEGVPLREVLWRTEPTANLRRVFYHGYHNDDPKQLFRSSLPVGRVLEDYDDLPPVILCYKLNGEFLTHQRGAPVRVVVPEAYGFKSIKWLTKITLSNLSHANDTYADGNNDLDSPLKTFADTLTVPDAKPGQPIPVTGYAQVGIAGLAKVQVWVQEAGKGWPKDDPYFTKAPWVDATILGRPRKWGGDLPNDAVPAGTFGFDEKQQPRTWPMRLSKAHWAVLVPGLKAGKYTLRCRSIDAKGHAQPMPRPFKKSGRCDIKAVPLRVQD